MGARRQHGVRPGVNAIMICNMKVSGRDSEAMKIASHFVQRHEPVVTVKGCVLQSFGHYRAGELLKPHCEGRNRISVSGVLSSSNAGQEHVADKVENTCIGGGASPFCSS